MLKLNAATGRPLAGYALAVFFVTGLVYCTIYTAFHSSLPVSITFTKSPSSIGSAISSQNSAIFSPDRANRLPHVPPKIWQIWLDSLSTAPEYYKESSQSFIRHSAGHAYTVIDGPGARSFITTLSKFHEHANLLSQYHAISRRVVRVDFLRYLVLAVEGGIYSDADTMMLRPVDEWVPAKYKRKAKLIVGIEADSDVPTAVTGAAFQVRQIRPCIHAFFGGELFGGLLGSIFGSSAFQNLELRTRSYVDLSNYRYNSLCGRLRPAPTIQSYGQ
jgi:hypothetical protein